MPNGKRVVHCPLIWPNCLLLLRENRNFSLIYNGIELLEFSYGIHSCPMPVDLIDKLYLDHHAHVLSLKYDSLKIILWYCV